MKEVVYIVSFIVVIISYNLFKKAAGTLSLRKLNTASYVFFYCIIISTFVGSVICVLTDVDWHWILCNTSLNSRIIAWIAICYSLITIPLGMIITNNLYGVNISRLYSDFENKELIIGLSNRRISFILFFMSFFSILVSAYIKHYSGSWPLYTAVIEKDFLSAAEGRIDVRLNFHGIEYVKNLFGLCLVPMFSYFAYVIWFKKRTLFCLLSYLVILLCTLFIISYDTQKAPLIFYLIGYVVIYPLIAKPISKKALFVFFSCALFLMGLLYISFSGTNNDVLDIVLDPGSAMWSRMFISSYAGVPLSFEWFPNVIEQPTWQIGIPEFILKTFDLPTTESARLMMLKLNPEGNLISSYFIAEAWANYGFIGVFISPFIIGFSVQFVHLFLLRHGKDPLAIAFYAYMTTKWVISSGFVNYLYFKAILIPLVLYYCVRGLIYKYSVS